MPDFRQRLILFKPMRPGVSGYARLQSERGALLAQLNAGSRAYGQRGTQGGFGAYLCSNPCLTLCLANALCNCCCLGGRGGFYYC